MISLLLAITFSVVPEKVEINEPVTVTLELPQHQKIDTALLRGKLVESGNFMLLSEKAEEKEGIIHYEWVLEPLKSGTFPISLYKLELKNEPAVYFKAFLVEVAPFENPKALPPPPFIPLSPHLPPELTQENRELLAQIQEKQPALNVALLRYKTFPWGSLLLSLIILSAGMGLLWYLEWKERNTPPPTPEEEALKALHNLEQDKFTSPKEFITRLSQTLREFVQDKFGIASPYQTTEEFLKTSTSHPDLEGSRKVKLALFLAAADQVKFAGHTPSQDEKDKALLFAKSFVATESTDTPSSI